MIATHNHDHDLEDHIEMLRKLDEARQYSANQRDEGIDVLVECLDLPDTDGSIPDSGDWQLEMSLVVRALLTRHNQPMKKDKEEKRKELIKVFSPTIKQLIEKLKKELTLVELDKNELSVLVAANSLRAMTGQPGKVFSKEAMYCYYWIIRELYTADRGDWNIGGARAAPKGSSPVTAFTTGECVRALLMFAETMKNAGEFVGEIANYLERKEHLSSLVGLFKGSFNAEYQLGKWVELEEKRARLSCLLKLQKYSRYIALNVDNDFSKENHTDTFITNLNPFIREAIGNLTAALNDISDFRAKEKETTKDDNTTDKVLASCLPKNKHDPGSSEKMEDLDSLDSSTREKLNNATRSESAHWIAILAVKHSLERVQKVQTEFENSNNNIDIKKIKQLKTMFDDAVREIRKLLRPVRNYLSSIIDRELTLVSLGKSWDWQPAELASAASCYGRLTNEWKKDKRFNQAVNDLSQMISSRGRFANPTKYHEQSDGVIPILLHK